MRRTVSVIALAAGCGLLTASALASARETPPPNVFRASYTIDIDYVDPALSYYAPAWALHYATGAWLFNYPDAPAPRGARLVPEVALGFPRVSKDGKTYTFRLKKTYRFSDGRPVTASSFAGAINRVLSRRMASPGQYFVEDIVGAKLVANGATRRASGVRVLDRWTLQIRLVRRSGDLPARLAMPFFTAIPTTMPINPDGVDAPYPTAGPYTLREWTKNRRVILERNRFYRGPRPHNVSRIEVDVGLPLQTIKLKIDRGETDFGDTPPTAHAELGAQYGVRRRSPGRYFANPAPTVLYLALNRERHLFGGTTGYGHWRLAKAVNYAIDRAAMLHQRGAFAGSAHDQLLPPTMHGFRDVTLYPRRPDLRKARRLATGHLRGGKGRLFCPNRQPAPATCEIVHANLREIGLDLQIVVFSPGFCFDYPPCKNDYDLSLETWRVDYFDPYDFLFLVHGRSIHPSNTVNVSQFDSARFNRLIDAANALTGEARFRAFGKLDAELMREAAPVAVYASLNDRHYVSARTGCYHHHPVYGFDFPAICVR